MAVFEVKIDDLWGTELASTSAYLIGEGADPTRVEIPINGPRIASVSFSVYQSLVQHLIDVQTVTIDDVSEEYLIGALSRMLRVYWRGHLVFRGLIHAPTWRAKAGTVTPHAMDPWLRVMHHFLRIGDSVVGDAAESLDEGYTVPPDFRTMREVIKATRNTTAQAASGLYPDIGIAIGAHKPKTEVDGDQTWPGDGSPATLDVVSTADFPAAGTLQDPSDSFWPPAGEITYTGKTGTSFTGVTGYAHGASIDDGADVVSFVADGRIKVERGTNCADQITEISEMAVGADFELEPVDDYGDTESGSPWYVRFNTFDQQGSDKSEDVVFIYDETDDEGSNLEDIEWEPDGTSAITTAVMVAQGTEDETAPREIRHNLWAARKIGFWVDWQNPSSASGQELDSDALGGLAEATVEQFARPQNQMRLTLKLDPATGDAVGPRYIDDFVVGDYVTVRCKKGYMEFELVVRIVKVALVQVDAAGNVQPELEVVPKVAVPIELSGGTDDDG